MEKFDERSSTPPEEDAIFPQIEDELPPWANRDTGSQDLQSSMAECQVIKGNLVVHVFFSSTNFFSSSEP